MKRFLRCIAIAMLVTAEIPAQAQVKHVILISIDGFHPDMYLDKSWPTPNLRYLMKNGTYADHLLSVFPSFTYPSHTAMVTGAYPGKSRVTYNQPIGNNGEWNWYYKTIKAPTLWDALHSAHQTTAALMWPVTVGADIDHNLSELWDVKHPDDRITVARNYTSPANFVEELEQHATGKLDSANFNDKYFSMDENVGRMASYVIEKYKPNFLALHVICADDFEHDYGRDADTVRLAMENNDRVIGNVLEAINKSGIKDSTAVIVVGDHGFANINQVMRPNMLINGVDAEFVAAGGSCFLYRYQDNTTDKDIPNITKAVTDSLDKLPEDKRKLFRIISRNELDEMGADPFALIALAAQPGLVFSSATSARKTVDYGPGTLTQNNKLDGVFYTTHGGHHGYDPNIPEMYTGFIAYGAGINKGGHITSLREVDIAPLIAKLLGITFNTPDGKLVNGILTTK